MKKFEKIFFSMIAMIMMVAVGSVFTSCTNDDDFRVPAQEAQLDQALSQDSVAPMTRAMMTSIETNEGWTLEMDLGNLYGYKLYKQTINLKTAYLQKVNLSMGPKLAFQFGTQTANSSLPHSPYYERTSISSFWSNKPTKAISVTNCSYFGLEGGNQDTTPAVLSFPIKVSGVLKSTGSYNNLSYKKKIGFNFSTQESWIDDFNVTTNNYTTISNNLLSPTAICGYSPDAEVGYPNLPMDRFMIGIKDQDNDGKNEVVYILMCNAKQSTAKNYLISLGCSSGNIIMLDGHYSAQMIAKNPDDSSGETYKYNYNKRTVPNAMFVCKP